MRESVVGVKAESKDPDQPIYCLISITKICLFKYIEKFSTKKGKFSEKNSDIFHISAQNTDCGYLLELPLRGSSNEYPQKIYVF